MNGQAFIFLLTRYELSFNRYSLTITGQHRNYMSESFSELFENSETQQNVKPGALIMGTVVSMNREKAIINVGLKSEGFISLNEFKDLNGVLEITEGDVVELSLIHI